MAANIVPQDILPLSVQQIAASERLGTFMKMYKSSLTRTIIGAIFFLLGGVLFVGGGALPPDLSVVTRAVLLIFGLLFLGLTIYMVFTVIQAAGQQIFLFQQGMVIEKKGQLQVFPWNQAAEVWQSITRQYRNGVYVGTTYNFTLRRTDGYQIKLGNLTKNIAELGPAISEGVSRALVPRAFQSLQAGQTLTFAPFSITLQGISNGRETISWAQVQGVDVKQGRLTVRKTGSSRSWGTVMVSKIPNFLVFIVVAEELIRRAGGGR